MASFTDRIVFETSLVRIGAFRCDSDHPDFRDTGPTRNDCFVFPRTAVQIEHEHQSPFAANPNVVTFYNRSQRYLRHRISERGDRCDWFGVDRDLARDVVRSFDPSVEELPFRWTRGTCDAPTYLLQRRLFERASSASGDRFGIEEMVVFLLEKVVAQSLQRSRRTRTKPNHREIVHAVECLLGEHFEQPLSLSAVAQQVDCSVYHLCRIFREVTGTTLHDYRQNLRIRHGLERVCESGYSLSRIAVDLGYSHHSHFTSAFHRGFGCTPSTLRPRG